MRFLIKRVRHKIIRTGKWITIIFNCLNSWFVYLKKNPEKISLFPKWLISQRRRLLAYSEKTPLWPFDAIDWLNANLHKEMVAFEYGSGGSTLFISQRIKHLTTVEDIPRWYNKIHQALEDNNITNCDYVFRDPKFVGWTKNEEDYGDPKKYLSGGDTKGFSFEDYAKTIDKYPDNYFDIVLLDGRARNSCIYRAVNKIRPGGHIFIDDSEIREHQAGIELLKNWGNKTVFNAPKFYFLKIRQATVWQKPNRKPKK